MELYKKRFNMNTILLIILVIWLIGIIPAYKLYIKDWENPKGEKIYFSIMWPLIIPLYIIIL